MFPITIERDAVAPPMDAAEALRDAWPGAVAAVVGLTGDLQLAEDAAQDACVVALAKWPVEGVPRSPGRWLAGTARHKALDIVRRDRRRATKEALAALEDEAASSSTVGPTDDDRLSLIFLCCHAALAPEARLALTLRSVAGVSTEDIAALFLQFKVGRPGLDPGTLGLKVPCSSG